MTKVSITVYISKEIKDMLSKRQVSISSWVRSAINLKIGKEKVENSPKWKKYKIKKQKEYRRKNKDFINTVYRLSIQSVRKATGTPLPLWVVNIIRCGLRR